MKICPHDVTTPLQEEESPQNFLSMPCVKGTRRKLSASRKWLSPRTERASNLNVDFPASRLWEANICYLNHPVCDILSWQHKQTKTIKQPKSNVIKILLKTKGCEQEIYDLQRVTIKLRTDFFIESIKVKRQWNIEIYV